MGIKTKIALAMATTAVGATLAGAGSFALFTSQATNSGNTFTAGTLVITDQTTGSVASQAVNFNKLQPGDSGDLTMSVKNTGTLDAWVQVDQTATSGSEVGSLFGSGGLTITTSPNAVLVHAGQTVPVTVHYGFPLTANDTFQGATGSFNVVVDAVQARNNTNSSGNGPTAWR
jgi:spore coat-associated protein N